MAGTLRSIGLYLLAFLAGCGTPTPSGSVPVSALAKASASPASVEASLPAPLESPPPTPRPIPIARATAVAIARFWDQESALREVRATGLGFVDDLIARGHAFLHPFEDAPRDRMVWYIVLHDPGPAEGHGSVWIIDYLTGAVLEVGYFVE